MSNNNPGLLRYVVEPKDVYEDEYTIPLTYKVVGFRPPLKGEEYLCSSGRQPVKAVYDWTDHNPRFILVPLPKKLKVTFIEKDERCVKLNEWYKYGDRFYQFSGEKSSLPYKIFDRIEEQI